MGFFSKDESDVNSQKIMFSEYELIDILKKAAHKSNRITGSGMAIFQVMMENTSNGIVTTLVVKDIKSD